MLSESKISSIFALKRPQFKSKVRLCAVLNIIDINLRNTNFYHHIIDDHNKEDYVAYGVKLEGMRKVLIVRAPYVFNNLTDVNYKLRLLKFDGKTTIKTITLEPGQCYPIDIKDIEYKF